MVSDSFVVVVVVNAVICSFLGALIGGRRDAAGNGAILGFLFGELGLIVAFALDGRPPNMKKPPCKQACKAVGRSVERCLRMFCLVAVRLTDSGRLHCE